MKPVQIEKWLTRKEAAELIGVGERRILALAKEGAIRSKRERDETSHQMSIKIESQSLKAYIDKQNNGDEGNDGRESRALQTVPKNGALIRDLLTTALHMNGGMAAKDPLWLTLDRAAEASGLPAVYLRRLIERGELPARDIYEGTGARGPSWRVAKQDLEGLKGKGAHV